MAKSALSTELYLPTEILVSLNDVKGPKNVFFVHPMEGHTKMLKELAVKIRASAYGLQLTETVPSDLIQSIANCYIQEIKKIQQYGPYRLVGCNLGAAIAFEMAVRLQKTDQLKAVICIDNLNVSLSEQETLILQDMKKIPLGMSPVPIQMFLSTYLENVPKHVEDEINALIPGNIMSDALTIIQKILVDKLDQSLFETCVQRLYNLCWAVKNYSPSAKLVAKTCLVRGIEGQGQTKIFVLDEPGLREAVNAPIQVTSLNCSRKTLLKDQGGHLSKFINDRI